MAIELIRRAIAIMANDPAYHVHLGDACQSAGRLDEAVAAYSQAIGRQPTMAEAHNNLANVFREQGKLDSAAASYSRAIGLKPGFAEAHSNLGDVLRLQNKLDEAASACATGVALNPALAEAHFHLGNVLLEQKNFAAAVAAYTRAVRLKPAFAEGHNGLGNALREQGLFDDAVAAYETAIQLHPRYAHALSNLGNVWAEQGRVEEALGACRRAIELQPDLAEAHHNLGNALRQQDKLDESIDAYSRAIALNPAFADAFSNLAGALWKQGKLDEALAAVTQAIRLKPAHGDAFNNLGTILQSQGKLDAAIAAYNDAIRLKPQFPDACNNLGSALREQGKLDEAVAAFSRAVELKQDYAEAHNNLGNALRDVGDLDRAVTTYSRAVELKSDCSEAFNNLGNVRKDQGLLDEALACYDRSMAENPRDPRPHSNRLYALHFHPSYDGRSILSEHLAWNHLHARPLQKKFQAHENDRSPDRRLRIGYVAPDFRDHCQSLFTVPLLSHHDHDRFEIFCYSGVVVPDGVTDRIKRCADVWRNIVGISDDAVVDLIRQDKIDILIDLTLHMSGNRLLVFARKPAPVQVTWLGYPSTTGLATIDYRFSDPYLDPPDVNPSVQDEFYTEQTLRLADTFWCYDPLTSEPQVNGLPALGSGSITFGCLNNFCKVNENVLDLSATVLKAVPNSRLMLLAAEGSHRQRTRESLAKKQIDPARIEFVGYCRRRDYLDYYHRIDIGLDTFPYNGHTTSLDSYWMGVPVVTLVGQTAVGRAGLSQLSNLGLTELIARTPEQYAQIASQLAGDLPKLSELRAGLRERMSRSPLMDGPRFAGHIETAYRDIWQEWCKNSG
jgi:predicted O-linked N-acetylglucosamine transferase (SPINDLY family)